MTADVFSPNIS